MSKERTEPINYRAKIIGFFVTILRRFIRYVPSLLVILRFARTINKDNKRGKISELMISEIREQGTII